MKCSLPISAAGVISMMVSVSAHGAVGPDVVRESIRVRAAHDLGLAPDRIEVEHLGMGRALNCSDSATVSALPVVSEQWRGLSDVTIVASEPSGVTCDRLRLRPRVEVWVDAPIATSDVASGEPVAFRLGRARRSALVSPPVSSVSENVEARVPISRGDVVTIANARVAPDARSGQPVTVVVARGALRVEAPGRLMADASVGDAVRVANLATGAVMHGALIGPNVVQAGGTP